MCTIHKNIGKDFFHPARPFCPAHARLYYFPTYRELIGKHIGLFSEKVQLSGAGGGPLLDSLSIRLVRPGEKAGQGGECSPEIERDDDDENEA